MNVNHCKFSGMSRSREEDRLAFAERLTKAWRDSGRPDYGKYSELGRFFNITPSAVKRWFDGETIPTSRVGRLAAYLNVRAEWLLANRGPMKEVEAEYPGGKVQSVEIHRLPIIGPEQYKDHISGKASVSTHALAIGNLSQQSFAYQLRDNSLLPEAVSGMIAVVDPENPAVETPVLSSLPVVVLDDGAFVAGKYIQLGTPMIEPLNRDYKPIQLSENHEVVGVIAAFTQKDM